MWETTPHAIEAVSIAMSELVRTDFSDDAAWEQIADEATREYGPDGFRADVSPVSDPQWADASWAVIKAAAETGNSGPIVLFIADSVTFSSADHPVLAVDLSDKILSLEEFPEIAGRMPFRCVTAALWDVENNLSLANLDWEDYARQLDDDGIYHGFELPPPPTPAEKAEAARQERLAEELRREQRRQADELRYWGGSLPSDRVRSLPAGCRPMARLDVELAEAIAATDPGVQRTIARWAARRAYEAAGIASVDWVAPALEALDHDQELPPPFDNREQLWLALRHDPRVPRRTVKSPDGSIPNMHQASMAVPALFGAARPDPAEAAFQALYHAVAAFGGDDYPVLLQEVRDTFRL